MRRLAIALIAAGALFSGAARADESFDNFRNFCVATRGQSASALALADASGWQPLPPQFLSQLPPPFQGAAGRGRQVAGVTQILITASGSQGDLGPARVCAVGVAPAGASDLAGQLQAFAAVPKQNLPNAPEGLYIWRDENGRHIPLARNAPDFSAQFSSGALIASTTTLPQIAMILLLTAQ